MGVRHFKKGGLLGLLCVLVWSSAGFSQLAPPSSALRVTEAHLGGTSETVQQGRLLVGLRQMSYGIVDRVSLETIPLFDLLGAWNAFGKVKLFEHEVVSVAGRTGFFYLTLDTLPELQWSRLYRYFLGGTVSFNVADALKLHLNVSNTNLHGNVLANESRVDISNKLTNVTGDVEYHLNDKRAVLTGIGYDTSLKRLSLGGSHRWKWTKLYLKLGMTFKMAMEDTNLNILPHFDLGILL